MSWIRRNRTWETRVKRISSSSITHFKLDPFCTSPLSLWGISSDTSISMAGWHSLSSSFSNSTSLSNCLTSMATIRPPWSSSWYWLSFCKLWLIGWDLGRGDYGLRTMRYTGCSITMVTWQNGSTLKGHSLKLEISSSCNLESTFPPIVFWSTLKVLWWRSTKQLW